MKKVFWGFFFVYLNFNLTLNGHALNLLPDFVGYILLFQAAGAWRGRAAVSGPSGPLPRAWPFTPGSCGWGTCWLSPAAAAGWTGY